MIPGGYSGHLIESDSLSSSMEGELDDEDEDNELEEALALHPGTKRGKKNIPNT